MELPDNKIDPSESLIGLYYLSSMEPAAQVQDVEFDVKVYGDGSIEITNKIGNPSDRGDRRVKLSPSQVAILGRLIMSPAVPEYKENE